MENKELIQSETDNYMKAWKQGRYDTTKMILSLVKHLETKYQVIECIEKSLETIKEKGGYDYE